MTSTVAKYAVRRRRSIYKQHLDDRPTIQERQHDVRGFGRSPGVDSVLLAARSTIFLLRSFCFTPVSKRERERSYKGGEPNILVSSKADILTFQLNGSWSHQCACQYLILAAICRESVIVLIVTLKKARLSPIRLIVGNQSSTLNRFSRL